MKYVTIAILLATMGVSAMARPATKAPRTPTRSHVVRVYKSKGNRMKATINDLLDAIQQVETGSSKDPVHAVGDQGRSHGWMQIMQGYFDDALPYMQSKPPSYLSAVQDRNWSRLVVLAYWRRYCPIALSIPDLEQLARVHNGGGAGACNPRTLRYWAKVQAVLRAKGFEV